MKGKIIKGAWVMTEEGLKKDYGVKIKGNEIIRIGPNKELAAEDGEEEITLPDQMILPGFVNGHNHMYGFLSHGITADAMVTEFASFLDDFWWPYVEDRLNHELVAATAQWACVEMVESGVTAFVDILEGPNAIPGALETERQVITGAGLRGRLSFEACERVSRENGELGVKENLDFIRRHNREDNLVQGLNSIHTLFTGSGDFIRSAKARADELGAVTHMHLSESIFEPRWCREHYGKLPVEVYEEWGFLDQNVLASQVVQASDRELDILARHGVKAVTMPLSNCEVGGGFAPVTRMLQRGIPVGLGSDGYINNFFEVMRGAFLVHKANQQNPQVMPAETVYKMATSMGAEAAGLTRCGVLKEGNYADLITLSLALPTPVNEQNVYDQIVLFANPEQVKYVMVNGAWLKRDGRLMTIEKEKARQTLYRAAETFWQVHS